LKNKWTYLTHVGWLQQIGGGVKCHQHIIHWGTTHHTGEGDLGWPSHGPGPEKVWG